MYTHALHPNVQKPETSFFCPYTRTSFIESNQLRQVICIVGNGAPHAGFGAVHACTHNYSSFSLSFFLPTFSYIMTTLCAVFCLPTGLSLSNTIRAISAEPLSCSPWSFLHLIPFVPSLLASVHLSSEPLLLTPTQRKFRSFYRKFRQNLQ